MEEQSRSNGTGWIIFTAAVGFAAIFTAWTNFRPGDWLYCNVIASCTDSKPQAPVQYREPSTTLPQPVPVPDPNVFPRFEYDSERGVLSRATGASPPKALFHFVRAPESVFLNDRRDRFGAVTCKRGGACNMQILVAENDRIRAEVEIIYDGAKPLIEGKWIGKNAVTLFIREPNLRGLMFNRKTAFAVPRPGVTLPDHIQPVSTVSGTYEITFDDLMFFAGVTKLK